RIKWRRVESRHMHLPGSEPRRLEIHVVEIEQHVARHGALLAGKERAQVHAVERIRRQRRTGKTADRRQDVEAGRKRVRNLSGGNKSRKSRQERHTHAAFENLTLAAAEPSRASLEPRAMVARKHHKGVGVQTIGLERLKDLSYARVYVLDR